MSLSCFDRHLRLTVVSSPGTFERPNANDGTASEQSQDWTLHSALRPPAAFHHSKAYLPTKQEQRHCGRMQVACWDAPLRVHRCHKNVFHGLRRGEGQCFHLCSGPTEGTLENRFTAEKRAAGGGGCRVLTVETLKKEGGDGTI